MSKNNNLTLTNKQFGILVKMIYLGNWMANAEKTKDQIEEFNDLESYVLTQAESFQNGHLAKKIALGFIPSAELEEDSQISEVREAYIQAILTNIKKS